MVVYFTLAVLVGVLNGFQISVLSTSLGRTVEGSRPIFINLSVGLIIILLVSAFVNGGPSSAEVRNSPIHILLCGLFLFLFLALATRAGNKIGFFQTVLLMLSGTFLARTAFLSVWGNLRSPVAASIGALFLLVGIGTSLYERGDK